jgi:Zn-dependent membrane protease YugP
LLLLIAVDENDGGHSPQDAENYLVRKTTRFRLFVVTAMGVIFSRIFFVEYVFLRVYFSKDFNHPLLLGMQGGLPSTLMNRGR